MIFRLDKSAFAYWSEQLHDWFSESGEYNILIAESSDSVCLEESVHFNSSVKLPIKLTLDNTGGDIRSFKEGEQLFMQMLGMFDASLNGGANAMNDGEPGDLMALAMANDLPLHAMVSFSDNKEMTRERMQMMVDKLNELLNQ